MTVTKVFDKNLNPVEEITLPEAVISSYRICSLRQRHNCLTIQITIDFPDFRITIITVNQAIAWRRDRPSFQIVSYFSNTIRYKA